MGDKGARHNPAAQEALERLLDDLAPLGHLRSKKMFGGHGVFLDDTMFAIVDPAGHVFLRGDDSFANQLQAAGSERHGRMPYWSVTADVNDTDALIAHATRAVEIATASKPRQTRR